MGSTLLWAVFTVISLITIVLHYGVNGDDDVTPECNSTCRYIAWAFDANCRERKLDAVPQECWEAKTIDLRDNQITRIMSNVFGAFRNLLYVDLEFNGIVELDADAFVGNDRVRHIYLQSNQLEIIRRDTFTGVPNLLQLYLNSNRIRTVETGAFSGLSKLEMLFLSENELDDLPVGLLGGLTKLKYFHMTHNRLTILRNDTFKNLAAVRHLNFINNNIRVIEAGAFKGLLSLQSLRLAYNDISIIGFRAFSRLRSLIQLDLYSNKIETISNFTNSIRNIDELYLGDNPLKCDCQIAALKSWYVTHEITDSKANATCGGPESVQGVAVIDVEVVVCSPPEKPNHKVIMEEEIPNPDEFGSQDGDQSFQQSSSTMPPSSTLAVVVIVGIVLFAVFFVSVICLVYNRYYRKPFNHKQYYKQVSQISRTESVNSNGSKRCFEMFQSNRGTTYTENVHVTMKTSAILTLFAVEYCIFLCGTIPVVWTEECNEICDYSPDHNHADCSNQNLDIIPVASQCSEASFLDFRRNALQYLDESSLSGYGKLRYVYLEYNNIRNITPRAFAACVELKEIFLQNNPLVIIVNNTFYGLSKLRNLYLNVASLEVIEAGAFAGLNSIERLYLNDNGLRTLPHNVFHSLRTLRFLMLSNNRLEYFHSEQFQGLAQLKRIEIQNNLLMRLESGMFRGLPSLTSLIASHNSISEIHVGALEFESLGNLAEIDLSFNNIIDVRNISSGLVDIQRVFFAGNPMSCGCTNEVLMQWYEKHVQESSTIIADTRTEVICQGPEDFTGMPMKDVSQAVILKCKDLPKPTSYDKTEVSVATVLTGASGYVEIIDGVPMINEDDDKRQMAVAQESALGSDQQEDGQMYMFIGISALVVCLAVIIIFAVLIYRRYSDSQRPRADTQDKNIKGCTPSPRTGLTENPLPDEPPEEDEEVLYEPIANMQEFPTRTSRSRLISERSFDSAFSEGSFPESDDISPPKYPPPPPPPHANQSGTLSGYIPVYQSENGKVYLCTKCPHSLVHSTSVPAHCSDLINPQSQPLLLRQHSYPERRQHPPHHDPAYTYANQPNDQITSHHGQPLPSYAQVMKHQLPEADFPAQTQEPQLAQMYDQNEVQDNPPIPLQTDIADYSQLDLSSYPSTNPFSTQRLRSATCVPSQHSSSQPCQPRRVSFSDVNTVYTQNTPVLTRDNPGDNPVYIQNNPVST
ncbi:uncharacterized protein [Amphiura filiformis]|uniref:uncharacterized protein n=1 Tax=Amphiura filiformis TaxID=82378 RepID=UPI003B222C7D